MTDTAITDADIYSGLARAIGNCARYRKDQIADTGSYKYSYASLTDVLSIIKTALREEGLMLSQPIRTEDGVTFVDTLIIHTESGHYLAFPGLGGPVKGDPQAAGSAITYARRYNITSLFCLEVEDDDGATAAREANAAPGERTEAEKEVRSMIAAMPDEERHAFITDFKFEHGMGLTDLPMSKHGDALTWAKQWTYTPARTAADEAADSGEGY